MVLDKKKLNQILSDQSLYEKDGVKINENKIDSFELISLLSQIEETNGIEIDIEKLNISFVTKKKFEDLIQKNSFYEYAEIFGNYYGNQGVAWEPMENTRKTQVLRGSVRKNIREKKLCAGNYGKHTENIGFA